jgi:lipopolysaccharide export system protein LptC
MAPAINWMSSLFTKENYHSMTLRGSRASFPAIGEINVVNLNLTAFSGDASNRVETVILSTAATVLIKEDLARGDQGMRLIRDDLEATGTRWIYDHAHKKVSLHGRVRIVFNAELKNLIK